MRFAATIDNEQMKKFFMLISAYYLLLTTLYAAAFVNSGLNARPQALGDAFTAVSDDLNSVYYNPAGIAKIRRSQILLSHRDFYGLGLLHQNYIGFSIPARFLNTAFSIHRIATTDKVEFISYTEDTYILTLAGKFGPIKNLFTGMNFKFYRVSSERNASGYGIDFGALYQFSRRKLKLGLMIQNLNYPEIIWDTGTKNILTPNFRLGMSFIPIKNILVAFDCNNFIKFNFGFELRLLENIFIFRAGISDIIKIKTISTGISLNFNKLQFDYTISKHRTLDFTQFLSVLIRI